MGYPALFGVVKSTFEAEEAAKKQEESAKKAEKAISQRYDREIAIASAAGKETKCVCC